MTDSNDKPQADDAVESDDSQDQSAAAASQQDEPGMPMPEDLAATGEDDELPPPPNFGKQLAQLVIIPAVIVIVCIGIALLFGALAGQQTDIDSYLAKLRQSSGKGKTVLNLQDPRYKDRGLAAYNIATMIPAIKKQDPKRQTEISNALIDILNNNVGEDEDMLQAYLLLAIGELGQEGGLKPIREGFDSKHATVRQAAVRALMSWPDREEASFQTNHLADALQDEDLMVASAAAAALGDMASPSDENAIAKLKETLQTPGTERHEVQWNAAIALTRLGDPAGEGIVVGLLLNREELKKMSNPAAFPGTSDRMTENLQNRVILSTLASAPKMQSEAVWAKIKDLAENDPDTVIRTAAKQLLIQRAQGSSATEGEQHQSDAEDR